MNTRVKAALVILMGLLLTSAGLAQKPAEMTGTWSGLAYMEGMDSANELVLLLELEEGKLKGHMTDEYGTMMEAAIYDVGFEEGIFAFSVKGVGPDGGEIPIVFKMTVDGGSMEGTFEIPDMGMAGTWEATKHAARPTYLAAMKQDKIFFPQEVFA